MMRLGCGSMVVLSLYPESESDATILCAPDKKKGILAFG